MDYAIQLVFAQKDPEYAEEHSAVIDLVHVV